MVVLTTVLSSSKRHAFVTCFHKLNGVRKSLPPLLVFFFFFSHAVSLLNIWHLLLVHFRFNQSGNETLSVLSFCLRTSTAGNFQFQGWHSISQVVITRDRVYSPSAWFIICCLCRRLLRRFMKIISLWGHAYFSHATRHNSSDRNLYQHQSAEIHFPHYYCFLCSFTSPIKRQG